MKLSRGQPILLAVAGTVVYAMPPFLTGALGAELISTLGFSVTGLGIAAAASRVTAALLAPKMGLIVDRWGASKSIRVGAAMAALPPLGIALTARNFAMLVGWLALAGLPAAIGQPAANRLLTRRVAFNRLGLAFGVKQSGPPLASMAAGLSVPLLALTIGWRWVYGFAGFVAVLVSLFARWNGFSAVRGTEWSQRAVSAPPVLLVTVASALGSASSMAVTTFLVAASVSGGTSHGRASAMLAAGSLGALMCRIVGGGIADRITSGHLVLCAGLALTGTAGIALLALETPWEEIAAVLALAGCWGFPGVLWYAIMIGHQREPGRVTGIVFRGMLLGGTVGPVLVGHIAETFGYAAGWGLTAGFSAAASLALYLAHLRSDVYEASPSSRWQRQPESDR